MIQLIASSPRLSPWQEEDEEKSLSAEEVFCLGCEVCGTCFELDDEPSAPARLSASAVEDRTH